VSDTTRVGPSSAAAFRSSGTCKRPVHTHTHLNTSTLHYVRHAYTLLVKKKKSFGCIVTTHLMDDNKIAKRYTLRATVYNIDSQIIHQIVYNIGACKEDEIWFSSPRNSPVDGCYYAPYCHRCIEFAVVSLRIYSRAINAAGKRRTGIIVLVFFQTYNM